jgi:hypothetical protein
MPVEHGHWIGTQQTRSLVREVILRELVMRVLLHDLRGSLTAVRGWVELLGMDGLPLPGGLTRSVQGFQAVVERYGSVDWPGAPGPDQPDILPLVRRALGVPTNDQPGPGPVDSLRLIAALELVAPRRVEMLFEGPKDHPIQVLRVHGLDAEAQAMGLTPHHDQILARLGAPDAALGICMLQEVARAAQGDVRSPSPGIFDLVFRV